MATTSDTSSLTTERTAERPRWIEPSATILIAVAAILTAWAAFQSAKWNGVQANDSRLAAAAGTASTRETTIASTQRNVDVESFLQWLQAARDDIQAGRVDPATPYVADPATLSGFIALRFRAEFKPAFNAWLATRPLIDSAAPATPFELPEYSLAADAEVDRLTSLSGSHASAAQQANNRAENYVLVTVLFAIGLVFASIGSKLERVTVSIFVLGLAVLTVIIAAVALATFPITV
jgi:protein-S-isoprenylcysteine O-methyltransferase Ste14